LNQRDKQARDKVSNREVTREFSERNNLATSKEFKFPLSTRLAVLCVFVWSAVHNPRG